MAIAYKLLRMKKGKLYPLYVLANEITPIGVWLPAQAGIFAPDGKHVKSRIGELCYRPGWHLAETPVANHIGVKDEEGNIIAMHPNTYWCECEFSDAIDYQFEADKNGMRNGKFNERDAMLAYIPKNGFYRYKTNPQMTNRWIIAGEMKLIRVLPDEEVAEICRAHGEKPLPRYA